MKRGDTAGYDADTVQVALTGRLTCANDDSDQEDQELGIDELSQCAHQPDATFAPSAASQSVATKRSKNTVKSSVDQQQRDVLLLRCRDAIEELHLEIEEERKAKSLLEVHLRDC